MEQYISKSALVAEIERRKNQFVSQAESFRKIGKEDKESYFAALASNMNSLSCFLDTLEVKDPYEQCVQHDSIKAGIQAHAETYSFNIESELFNQLTKEQQALWRREIEQACISGGDAGVELARDPRYKENLGVKEVDLEKEVGNYIEQHKSEFSGYFDLRRIARHFFELGLKAQKGE